MDLKALIAKMDQIESKKILTEAEDRPDAKKKETTWTDKSGKKHPATRVQGSKSVAADKEADKERKKNDKSLEEMTLKSAIAQELLKEFNVSDEPVEEFVDKIGNYFKQNAADYRARQASGELPPDGYDAERDGPWMGKTQQTNVVSGDGTPIKTGSGGNLVTNTPVAGAPAGAGTKPASQAAAPAAVPPGINPETGDAYTPVGSAPLTTPPGADPDEPQTSTLAEPPGSEETPAAASATDQQTIDPAKLARFKALLDKASAGAAAKPAAPAKKPATGAGAKPAASATPAKGPKVPAASAGADSPAYDTQDQGQISSTPAAESVTKLADDQILALIRGR